MRRGRLLHAAREVHHAHRVLDGHALQAAALRSFSVRPRHGQDQRLPAVHEVAAVELRAHLDGQLAACAAPRTCRAVSGAASTKLPPMPTKTFTSPRCIASIVAHGVEPVLARRTRCRRPRRAGRGTLGRAVVDAAGAVALHVRVPADRDGPGALAADVAAQQQQVDDLADRVDAVLLLGDAEAPAR